MKKVKGYFLNALYFSAQVPLVAANDLKSEMEGLHYREHKRLAIQGQIMAVYYVTLPEETLSDQVGFIDI